MTAPRKVVAGWHPKPVNVSPDGWQVVFALQSSSVVVNAIVSFIEPAQVHRSEEHVPGAAGKGLEADRERRQDVRHVHPALEPPNAAVG